MKLLTQISENHINKWISTLIPPESYVLDLMCEDAHVLQYLRPKTLYVGVEQNREKVEILRERFSDQQFYYFDVQSSIFPFEPSYFDAVILRGSKIQWNNLKLVLTEVQRIMKPNGKAFVIFPILFYNQKKLEGLLRYTGLTIEHAKRFFVGRQYIFILKRGGVN